MRKTVYGVSSNRVRRESATSDSSREITCGLPTRRDNTCQVPGTKLTKVKTMEGEFGAS